MANLVLLHAMWVGSGFACVMANISGSQAEAMVGTDMSAATTNGMDMPDMPRGATESHSKTPTHQHRPCEFPWAPDGCRVATPCLALAITSPAQALRVAADAPAAVAILHVLMPPSRGHPPEPPPPRA